MLIDTETLLRTAQNLGFAVGAFNIYNLEGATAVIEAAEELQSPVILQLLPSAIEIGGSALIAMCFELARNSHVPVSLHLDHCSDEETIRFVMRSKLNSVMADGSSLDFEDNLRFTRSICTMMADEGRCVEAELGKLSGEEDGISVADREAKLTDPDQAKEFVAVTGVNALAVCIGNIHGKYHKPPELDFDRLKAIGKQVSIPLVLHGTSGLPDEFITTAINHGICKFNVNTEVRSRYLKQIAKSFATSSAVELVPLMKSVIAAMKEPVQAKIHLFCSANKAQMFNIT